jgi:hypothetical protein
LKKCDGQNFQKITAKYLNLKKLNGQMPDPSAISETCHTTPVALGTRAELRR